jgi:hypothetical protein
LNPIIPDRSGERARRLYVIAFTSKTLKVGRAVNVASRLQDHIRDAAVHGHDVVASWSSELHANFRETEQSLIDFCSSRWPVAAREYFRGADFGEVVAFAKDLPYRPSDVTEDSSKAEARARRTAQLDRFSESVEVHRGLPADLWPEGTRALVEAGFAGNPDDVFGCKGGAR